MAGKNQPVIQVSICHTPTSGYFAASAKSGYVKCVKCLSFVSTRPSDPSAIYNKNYWSHECGHSTIEEQVHNVSVHKENGLTKNEFVLEILKDCKPGACVEIGCAPGVLLKSLSSFGLFDRVVGIEANQDMEQEIRRVSGFSGEILFGLFEDDSVVVPVLASAVVALDVFEHSTNPDRMIGKCSEIMCVDGVLVIMSPMAIGGDSDIPSRMFSPGEHVQIPSVSYMRAIGAEHGLTLARVEAWAPGHEVAVYCKESK